MLACISTEVGNLRPAGRMRPAWLSRAARRVLAGKIKYYENYKNHENPRFALICGCNCM